MKKRINFLTVALVLLCSILFMSFMDAKSVSAANDTSAVNTDQFTSEAVAIDYNGGTTKRYGMQAYAGVSGPLWILGDSAVYAEEGAGSHKFGSNNTDGRSNLTLTFKVNSTIAGEAYLGIHGLFNEHSGCAITVNDGEEAQYNLAEKGTVWNDTISSIVPVTLVEGENTIVLVMQENYTAWMSSFYITDTADKSDDSYYCNCPALPRPAETIKFAGETTAVYGIQSSAGIEGPAWVVGVPVSVSDALASHMLGSNTGDGRSALKLTFKVDSEYAMNVNLGIFGELYGVEGSSAVLGVNGTQSNINFYELSGVEEGAVYNNKAVNVPLTLVKGLNTITITMQENYGMWFGAYNIAPTDAIPVLPTHSEISIGKFDTKDGSMSAGPDHFGLNAYDSPADYGKTGSVTYRFTVEEAGDYYLHITAMAGANYANRIKITVNDEVQVYNEKEYLTLNTAAGWGGDSINTVVVSLVEGENVVKFENSLACLSADKAAEVEAGTEGSILVSNWWVHGVKFERVPNTELLVDTSNAKTLYNLKREFSAEGLVVSLKVDDEVTVLDPSQYTIDSSSFNSLGFGSYTISVKMNDSDLTANYMVSVVEEGQEWEGKVLDFDGEDTGNNTLSFYTYAEVQSEGTNECEGRLFWTLANDVMGDDGYRFGSNGAGEYENRQVTVTLHINSSVAGKYLLKAAIFTTNRDNALATIKINDQEAYEACLFYASSDLPYVFEVDLVEGLNTITIATQNQYCYWFDWFAIAPIQYSELNTVLKSNQGVRWGLDLIDCEAGDIWASAITARSLTYYYELPAGKYVLRLSTIASEEKNASVYINGTEYKVKVQNELTEVPFEVEAGKHRISIVCDGNNSNFALSQVKVVKDIKPVSLLIDTTNAKLTIPYDGILDTTSITAKLVYDDDSKVDLLGSEFKIVSPAGYSTTVAGTYEFKVVYKANEEIFATFNVVVEAEVVETPTPEEPTPEQPTPEEPTPEQPTPEQPAPGNNGCGGAIATSLFGLLALTGGLLFIRRKKED